MKAIIIEDETAASRNLKVLLAQSHPEIDIVATLESVAESVATAPQQNIQLSMFQLDDPVLVEIRDQIKGLDINSLTPLEALNKLNEIKRITGL